MSADDMFGAPANPVPRRLPGQQAASQRALFTASNIQGRFFGHRR
jgi:hypothetical protein